MSILILSQVLIQLKTTALVVWIARN